MLLVLLVPILCAQQLTAGMITCAVEELNGTHFKAHFAFFSALQASSMAYMPPSQLTNPGPHIICCVHLMKPLKVYS